MKRTLITSLLLLLSLGIRAEHSFLLSNALNGDQNYHYTANSHIMLSDGFKAEPQNGHEVLLDIDGYGVFPPETGLTGGTTANNDKGVVGSLGGVVDISLLGGAVYAIPIDLPSGLGGMKPQLTICYNSQDRNGLLGWGWNLGGLSSISRIGSTLYHDGVIGSGNRFCLDGKRLLQTSTGTYGGNGTSYRTEQDQMSKIVSYHENSISGPSYFKVWTTDGNILYYGHSADSKAFVEKTGQVNLWLLNKVVDRDGNTMEYHYTIEPDSYRIKSITYSSNASDNIKPAFRVEFNYNKRDDVDISFVGSDVHRKKDLLDEIKVVNGEAVMYTYQFSYRKPDPHEGYYYSLLTKIRLSAGNEHLNPTIVQWPSNNYTNITGSDLKYNVTTNGIHDAFINAVKFSGDFNGDGFDDVVALRPNSNGQYSQADVFLNKGVSGNLYFDHLQTIELSPNISWIQVADINGDCHDDILFSNRIRGIFPFPDHIETEIYLCRMTSQGGFEFIRKYAPICSVPNDMIETHLIGDFFGEGMNSILVQSITEDNGGIEASLLYRYDESSDEFQLESIPERLCATRFFPADFNGDGITEILYKKGNGATTLVQLVHDGSNYHYNEIYHSKLTDWEDCFPGDYNGDGLIDALFYTPNATQPWMILLSNQNGFNGIKYALPKSFPYNSPGDYQFSLDRPHHTSHYIKVGDFDGNGCSDLALYKDNRFCVFYGPIRAEGYSAPFANNQQISVQAFNLYDNMGICLGNFLGQERLSFLGPITLSRLPSTALRYEVKKVTDGLGRSTEFDYDYLMPNLNNPSDDDFYRIDSYSANHSRQVHSCPIPIRALKRLTTFNVSNKPVTTECHYEGALIHNQGLGFLGFSKTRQDDYCNKQLQKKTIRQYDIDYTYSVINMLMTEEDVLDSNDKLMARSTYHNRIYTHLKNDKIFIPISDKSIEEFDVASPNQLLKKEIHETVVETHCSQTNRYNEVISVTSQHKGTTSNQDYTIASICEYQEIYRTSYLEDNLNDWFINRPATTTSIAHREGDYADICHHKVFTYYEDKPHHIKSILDIPNDGSHPEDPMVLQTDYQYDPTGNITSQTTSAPNDHLIPRRESFEYSKAYGRRLLTKHTDALKQEYRYTYHPVYNYCTSITDCNKLTTEYDQDPLGITVTIHHPDGTVSCKALRWSDNAYYLWEKHTGHETKTNVYALTGDIMRTKSYDLNGELLLSQIDYDDFGRVVKKSAPYKMGESVNFTTYEYDSHNQICRIIHSDGSYEDISHEGNVASTSHFALDGSSQDHSKTFNVMGWVVKSSDAENNSVVYDYRADGKPLWSQVEGYPETRIEMDYDALGNQSQLTDPNYGRVAYEYNVFNELTHQTSPKLGKTDFIYDALGRIVKRIETDPNTKAQEVTEWTYGTAPGQRGLLTQISTQGQTISYKYDPLLRLTETNEQIHGISYRTQYTYDQASRVAMMIYPSKYTVQYHYTSEGYLKCITDGVANTLWKTLETNALMQSTKFTTGNGYVSEYGYDKNTNRLFSILTRKESELVQNLTYEYDDYNNLVSRCDWRDKSSEYFKYDVLNRLTTVDSEEGHCEFHYDPLGRMTDKSNSKGMVFGHADYAGPQPHAIKSAEAPHGVFPQERMDLSFNTFDKVESINEGNNRIRFEYGYNHQRIAMHEDIGGITRNKIYTNGCEFITGSNKNDVVRTFVSGPSGVFAVAETTNGNTTLHYIHKDHLGSWVVISDCDGIIEQENHFDAWGNCSNADELLFDRGYTGHEHIRGMKLINMNGRLYDPMTSCMLSPDNNIQMPDFTQNLNRYAYCLNNPLTYTDPDGNNFLETALIFYLVYCSDFGYEFQKYTQAIALHFDLHLSSQQLGIGIDFSFGIPKKYGVSYRSHLGASFYWRFYDDSYSGFEFRLGGEWCAAGCIGYSGTSFYQGKAQQTTNSIIIVTYWCNFAYENDYLFNLGKYIPLVPAADNGDRYRTAAARFRVALFSVGVNLYTGDPGVDSDDRRTFKDPDANGRETYTLSANGDNPDEYRAGVLYVGLGPFKIGANSEQIRNYFQNKFAHDFLCQNNSPYFKVLDRPAQTYFYFGTETGSTLW